MCKSFALSAHLIFWQLLWSHPPSPIPLCNISFFDVALWRTPSETSAPPLCDVSFFDISCGAPPSCWSLVAHHLPCWFPLLVTCHLSCNVLHLLIVVSSVDNSKQSKLTFVCDVGYWPLSGFTGSSQYKALNLIFGYCQKDCPINKFVLILHCKQLDHYVMANWQFKSIKIDLCLWCRVLATLRFYPSAMSHFLTSPVVPPPPVEASWRVVSPADSPPCSMSSLLQCLAFVDCCVFSWQFQTIKCDLRLCCRVLTTLRFHQFSTVQSVKFDLLKSSKRLVNQQVCTHLDF